MLASAAALLARLRRPETRPGIRVLGGVAVLTIAMLTLAHCAPRRPDFTTLVEQDCAAGDQWACDTHGRVSACSDTRA